MCHKGTWKTTGSPWKIVVHLSQIWEQQCIFHRKTGQVCWWRDICIQRVSWLSHKMEGWMTTLSESFLAHLRKWSPHVWFSTLNPRGCSFRMYKHACFDVLKKPLAITNSSTVNTLFLSCNILRSAISFGCDANMALACLPKFFVMAEWDCVSSHKHGHDVYLRWPILIGTAFFIKVSISDDIIDNKQCFWAC